MDDLDKIDASIAAGAPEQFILNCLQCCGVSFLDAVGEGCVNIVSFMIERGADIHIEDDWPLCFASECGHLEVVIVLLDRGAARDRALRFASANGHVEVVRELLDRGADTDNRSALSSACSNGHLEVVRELLDRGATFEEGFNVPLRTAIINGRLEVVRELLERIGVENNEYDRETLNIAERCGHKEIKKLIKEWIEAHEGV